MLSRRCLERRIGSATEPAGELKPWTEARNADGSRVHWRFTTHDARLVLRRLYPQV